MVEQKIECPHCGNKFALNEAFMEHFEQEKRKAVQTAIEKVKSDAEEERERLQEEFEEKREELQQKLEEQAVEQAEKEYQLKLAEKDNEMERIQKQLKQLQKRTLQGSMELQGEALETVLQAELEESFPLDSIEEIKKGQTGADIKQVIMNRRGQRCGTIIWEAKNTKNWNDDWLAKVKDDADREGAQVPVIVSVALPDEVDSFDLMDGVWVSSVDTAIALARVLRENLLQAFRLQKAVEGQEGKMEQVYMYLVSSQFRDRIQRMVETWQALKNQVDSEERAMKRQWKERRKQLDTMIDVTTEMYTDVTAIIGRDMPQVEGLSLESLPAGDDE